MEVKILASGSKGNCIYIESGGVGILIDVGLPKTKIEKRMIDAGINPAEIAAIFITHAHGDHVAGLPMANKYNIPVFASEGEWKKIETVDPFLSRPISRNSIGYDSFSIKDVHLRPFQTHHDAMEPLGYAIEDDHGNRCCVVQDTGHIDKEMLEMMEGNIYIIESNHEPAMVEASSYPISVQARILSDIGHLSNQQTAAALKRLVKGKGERIYLTHLSSSNNTRAIAENTVKLALFEKGLIKGKHYFLEVMG